jgi:hypothetical protein
MTPRSSRTVRAAGHLTAVLFMLPLLTLALLSVLASPADAAETCHWEVINGVRTYTCTDTDPGDSGKPGDGGSGGSKPTCDLKDKGTFCRGTVPCYYDEWHPPYVLPDGEKPSEDSEPLLVVCEYMRGGWEVVDVVWSDDGRPAEPSLADQATEAIGEIDLPTPDLSWNPPDLAYVTLPTWFWVGNATTTEVRGTSAFGLVAVATLNEVRVDPGDHTKILTCPLTTSPKAAVQCAHTYERASVRGGTHTADGRPAYEATMTTVWDLTFINDGVQVTIAGAPDTLTSDPGLAAVPVAEIQARVVH